MYDIYNRGAEGSEVERMNMIENYHSYMEGNVLDIFECLYKGDLSFWEDSRKHVFSHFMGLQYTRTKRLFDKLSVGLEQMGLPPRFVGKVNMRKITKISNLFLADSFGNWISMAEGLSLLNNISGKPFLTCDQPVYNLKADPVNIARVVTEMELYYPISPYKAVVISREKKSHVELQEKRVEELNQFLVDTSNEFTFGNSSHLLRSYEKTNKIREKLIT